MIKKFILIIVCHGIIDKEINNSSSSSFFLLGYFNTPHWKKKKKKKKKKDPKKMSKSSSNIVVCCRFRPENKHEKEEMLKNPSKYSSNTVEIVDNSIVINKTSHIHSQLSSQQNDKLSFQFDYTYGPSTTQETVFDTCAKPIVNDVLNGFNATIFAYGQTGSGKTYTMSGYNNNPGIIPRLIESIFNTVNNNRMKSLPIDYIIKISYVEIYNEKIQDLLDPSKTNLKLRESTHGIWIRDVTEAYVTNITQVNDIIDQGTTNRTVASTNMNNVSSRSHSIVIITIGQHNKETDEKKGGKLFLVDLAGSEKTKKTNAQGQRLTEAKHINKSLSALGNVINALTKDDHHHHHSISSPVKSLHHSHTLHHHIPYRDSILTRLLRDALGGNSKTCLIITVSNSIWNIEETISTLRFGSRAKMIKNKPKANVEKSIHEYKYLLLLANYHKLLYRIKLKEQAKHHHHHHHDFLANYNVDTLDHLENEKIIQLAKEYEKFNQQKGQEFEEEEFEKSNSSDDDDDEHKIQLTKQIKINYKLKESLTHEIHDLKQHIQELNHQLTLKQQVVQQQEKNFFITS